MLDVTFIFNNTTVLFERINHQKKYNILDVRGLIKKMYWFFQKNKKIMLNRGNYKKSHRNMKFHRKFRPRMDDIV